ncbi:hypothetical protein JRO89_XS03G0293100 [Xanthoceras sorbifolium]|uniref:SAM-dependent MTase RsmB/NOP-type domain-containing protein n=1 Tax=Xanthoceras sorbifolium TaxID=99658 RepID=A0ABQ8ICN9_9ROSI|nr:hypothetical protein JRO89_XS03G0293100 [Xanthoceras sorbifolium]
MVRLKTAVANGPSGAARKSKNQRLSSAERSAYFARREAAKVLRSVLQGDARRRAVGSIKSLVYNPSVRNKKATFALVCQTLKHLPIIKDVLETANTLNSKWKRQLELVYIITYDILFGKEISLVGDAEKFLTLRKDAIQSALARLLVRRKAKCIEDLVALYQTPGRYKVFNRFNAEMHELSRSSCHCKFIADMWFTNFDADVSKPRYVRVNTLKVDVESAVLELRKQFMVQKDDMVPDLLVLPPGCDLHDHPLVKNGSVFLQGKASSMVAAALAPEPGWKVLDACSAPGNKTVHLAAFMKGKGKIIACELNKERVKRLEETIRLSGAANIEVLNGDFLKLDPKDPAYSEVRAILLDPSCSGSGTAADRLDHLLPSHTAVFLPDASSSADHCHAADMTDPERLKKLAAFQKKALEHALSFPAVERIVYSTCSIHQTENEDVVQSVLPLAISYGFQLATPFPQWHRRGLPVFEGSEHLLRTDVVEDKEGFFIALFVRKTMILAKGNLSVPKKNYVTPILFNRMFKLMSHCRLRSISLNTKNHSSDSLFHVTL